MHGKPVAHAEGTGVTEHAEPEGKYAYVEVRRVNQ